MNIPPVNKPVILQNLGMKLLIIALCGLSFVAGYYAHQSKQINFCKATKQKPVLAKGVVLCQEK